MFEAILLLALLGIIVWFMVAKGGHASPRRATFINLTSELKPASKPGKKYHA